MQSPLPGGLSAIFRFLFDVPQWIQIGGAVVGGLVGIAVLVMVWRSRARIITWFRTRPRPVIITIGVVGVLALSGFAAGNAYLWHYTQHDNGFCTGCHVMHTAYGKFTKSQHSQLECHDCHQQPLTASMWQLVVWVAERPDKIPAHAKVPNNVCARCHVTGKKEVWQRVASTAGHRVHLESDSSALRGIQCVTCHGAEVHQFQPAARTCGQAGCHENLTFTLGKMRAQATSLHCVACHKFTADVPALATRDSAAGSLVPGQQQCMTCHQKVVATANFDAAKDPHNGTCGDCHNPHTQHVAADAAKTCASAGCHSDWRKSPFHTGVRHRDVASQCTLCHEPHQARVDASDCAGCHQAVAGRKTGKRTIAPPVPFDTTRALLQGAMAPLPDDDPPRGKGDIPPPTDPPRRPGFLAAIPAPADTFPHDRHKSLACITCHVSQREHGKLTFVAPRGCQICHHQQPAQSNCATCHAAGELATPHEETIRVAVKATPGRTRSVGFNHASHQAVKCVDCHTAPVSLSPDSAVRTCTSCHTSHHAADRACSGCHTGDGLQSAHKPALATHTGCDRCHRTETVAELSPTRSLCLTCHQPQRDHYADRQCTVCHFQASPEAYRAHLVTGGRG